VTTSPMQSIPKTRGLTLIRAPTVREGSAFAARGLAVARGPLVALVRGRHCLAILLVYILVLTAGCSKGRAYRLGRDAEKHGEAHVAYAYYCQAAVRRPDDGTISASIRRLNPAAATFWRQHAREAASQRRYADAWRMAMRCLRIRPDDADAAALVRELESKHSMAVAWARQAYERGGPRTLAVAQRRSYRKKAPEAPASDSPDVHEDAVTASALAGVGRGAGKSPAADLQTLADDTKIDKKAGKTTGEILAQQAGGNVRDKTNQKAGGARPPVSRNDGMQPPPDRTDRLRLPRDRDDSMRPPLDRDARMGPPRYMSDGARPPPDQSERVQQPLDRAPRMRPLTSEHESDAAIALTLSRRDKRYARRVAAMDGLSVRLRDTDSDPDADLDIYADDKRIRTIRDLGPGQSETFTTPSGSAYSVSLLSVNHPTRTVCIVIKPA
jgi:hypothetical protein